MATAGQLPELPSAATEEGLQQPEQGSQKRRLMAALGDGQPTLEVKKQRGAEESAGPGVLTCGDGICDGEYVPGGSVQHGTSACGEGIHTYEHHVDLEHDPGVLGAQASDSSRQQGAEPAGPGAVVFDVW